MLVVHDTAAWLLLAVCSLAGVVQSVGARLRAGGGEIGRLARVGGFADAVLTGLGVGMGAASIVLIAAAIIARLQA
jgi:hypothetical protein